jgi:hypothetical protein
MNTRLTGFQRVASFSVLALVIIMVAVVSVRMGVGAARSDFPPPDLPQFEGIPVSVQFAIDTFEAVVQPRSSFQSGWTILIEEDWEDGLDSNLWLTIDRDGTQSGDYRWGVRVFDNPVAGGTQSAWSIGSGQNGQNLDPALNGYPALADSWLIHGPIDLTNAVAAELSFNYNFQADPGDEFSVLISTNGAEWEGKQTDGGGAGSWESRKFSLDEYAGQTDVYLAFRFTSNEDGNNEKHATFVDDIVIRSNFGNKQFLPHVQVQPSPTPTLPPTPTPTPTPTPPPPVSTFLDEFTNDISGWEARRMRDGTSYSFQHRGDVDGVREGFLETTVNNAEGFVILSPLVPIKSPPYNIEFYAKLKDTEDRHMYGVVFGADWNGQMCATPSSLNCFTRYYELRVQYRDLSGNRFQELKLKRIDGHGSDGEPFGPTMIDWTRGGSVGPDDWAEIDVNVAGDGTIQLYWNEKFIAEAKDTVLLNQPYFGLLLITKENDSARVKYDYIKID